MPYKLSEVLKYRNHSLHSKKELPLGSKMFYFCKNMYSWGLVCFGFLFVCFLQFPFSSGKNYLVYHPSKHLPRSLIHLDSL